MLRGRLTPASVTASAKKGVERSSLLSPPLPMYIARPHENHESDTNFMKTAYQQVQAGAGSLLAMGLQRPAMILALSVHSLQQVSGTPIKPASLSKRDATNNSGPGGVNAKIYIPIVVFIIISLILISLSKKTSFRRALSGFALTGAAPTAGLARPTGAPREVTAEQLAGTINGEGATPVTTRRPRRTRRTPSQMSVTSLPAYNKEPGEEELVIFRGQDMEDATMPAAVVRHSVDESSLDHSQVSRYSPMPTSPHTVPLLNPDDTYEGDLSMQSLHLPAAEAAPRRSSDTGSHENETSSLMRTDSNDDARGEAPPYFEVVDRGASPETDHSHASPSTSPEPTQGTAGRRSGFRSLLNRMSMASQPNGHNRNESSTSAFSSGAGRDTHSRASNHRSNHSGSGSVLSASMFRTISRQRSTHTLASARNLTSPSMISLNSISHPLTHTVTRTEFTYPKTGLTAEQLKVISSREAFARFGVPYGADAIAFASSSRLDLMHPPPDFDTAASTSQLQLPLAGLSTSSSSNLPTADPPASTPPERATSPTNARASLSPSPSPAPLPAPTNDSAEGTAPKKRNSLVARLSTIIGTASTARSQTPSTASSAAADRRSVSEFGDLSPGIQHDRRASVRSTQTFATAVETLGASTRSRQPSELAESLDEASGRSTPVAGGHASEATDATVLPPVRPDDAPAAGSS